ncbi:hypothetical protein [Flavobacterium sp. ZS1P14]|uniref:hypothetical protein n=1 Tax=Flavobacterium sp. ZS1P14 TaxID=3401729 RepID=UPI003AAD669E
MRVVVFFVYLCFHLLGGGSYLHADTHHNHLGYSLTSNLEENQRANLTIADHHTIAIEYADLDLDEEYLSGHEIKVGVSNKFHAGKYSLIDNWYLPASQWYISNYYCKHFKIFTPFCGNSSPIYITNRVLRI